MQASEAGFDVVLRGYDRWQVDERLRYLGAELAATEQALGAAQERAAVAEQELEAARSELARLGAADPSRGFGERVERLLRLAEEESAGLRAEAAKEAAEVRDGAAKEVAEAVRQARNEAEQLVAKANATAQRREQDARRELDRLGGLRAEVSGRLRKARTLLDKHLKEAKGP